MANQRPCIICDRISSTVPISEVEEDSHYVEAKLAHFFQLLGRYLDDNRFGGDDEEGAEKTWRVPFERILSADKIYSCGDCSKIVQSFCELYQQLKLIELRLNCKVSMLKSMIRPQGVTKANRAKGSGGMGRDDVIDFRKSLIAQCDKKLKSSFPKLQIRQCHSVKSPEIFVPLPVKEEYDDESSDNMSCHGNDEMEFGDCQETTAKNEDNNMEWQPEFSQAVPNEEDDEAGHPVIPPIVMQPSDTPLGMEDPQWSLNPETGSLQCDLCQNEFSDHTKLQQHHKRFHSKIRQQKGSFTMAMDDDLKEVETLTPGLKVFPGARKNYIATYRGYVYVPNATRKSSQYLRCFRYTTGCHAFLSLSYSWERVISEHDEKHHNHDIDTTECDRRYVKWKIRVGAKSTTESPSSVVSSALNSVPEGSQGGFQKLRSLKRIVQRARVTTTATLPSLKVNKSDFDST